MKPFKANNQRVHAALVVFASAALMTSCSSDSSNPQNQEQPTTFRLHSIEQPLVDQFGNTLGASTITYFYAEDHELERIEEEAVDAFTAAQPSEEPTRVFIRQFFSESADTWIVEQMAVNIATEERYPQRTEFWADFELQYTLAGLDEWAGAEADVSFQPKPNSTPTSETTEGVQLPLVHSDRRFDAHGRLESKIVTTQLLLPDGLLIDRSTVTYEYNNLDLPEKITTTFYSGSNLTNLTPTGVREELFFDYPRNLSETDRNVAVQYSRYVGGNLTIMYSQTGGYVQQPCGEKLQARSKLATPAPLPWCLSPLSGTP